MKNKIQKLPALSLAQSGVERVFEVLPKVPALSLAEGACPELAEGLAEKMGKAGRKKFLEKYTLDIFEKNMKNVFDKILK